MLEAKPRSDGATAERPEPHRTLGGGGRDVSVYVVGAVVMGDLTRVRELTDTYGAVVYELESEDAPGGNAFMLLATWRRSALEWGWPESAVSELLREATSQDYRHLRRCLQTATGAEW